VIQRNYGDRIRKTIAKLYKSIRNNSGGIVEMYRIETNNIAKKKILDSIANIATKKTNAMKRKNWYYERLDEFVTPEKNDDVDMLQEIKLENLN
jgi:hypothetical protein